MFPVGCSISPLLFMIAIEPLAASLHSSPEIRSILRSGNEHKLSLYADDLLLYITDPQNTLPHIMPTLDRSCLGVRLMSRRVNFSLSALLHNHSLLTPALLRCLLINSRTWLQL